MWLLKVIHSVRPWGRIVLILLTDASFRGTLLIQDQNNAGILGILNTTQCMKA